MKCSASYTLTLVDDGNDGRGISSIEYMYATSQTETQPDDSAFQSDIPPFDDPTDIYLWQKVTTKYTDGTFESVVFISGKSIVGPEGPQGPKGESDKIYYQWSDSSDRLKTPRPWRYGNRFFRFNGKNIGDYSSGDWEVDWSKLMEERTDAMPFLWAKVGENGEPFLFQGVSPMDFSVVVSPSAYKVSPREITPMEVSIKATRLNGLKGVMRASLVGSVVGLSLRVGSEDDSWILSVAQEENTSLEASVEVSCGSISKTYRVSGSLEKDLGVNLGAVDFLPTSYNGKKLIDGDYFVVGDTSFTSGDVTYKRGTPYVRIGGIWQEMDISNADNAEKALACLGNILEKGISIPDTSNGLWKWCKNLVAQNAVIQNLVAQNFDLTNQAFKVKMKMEEGSPVYDVLFSSDYNSAIANGQTPTYNSVFSIDPSSGNVFLGKANATKDAPLSGFMFRASDESIVSVGEKVVINSNGNMILSNGIFNGTLNGASGSFSGLLNTPALRTEVNESSGTLETQNIPSCTTVSNGKCTVASQVGAQNDALEALRIRLYNTYGIDINGSVMKMTSSEYTGDVTVSYSESNSGGLYTYVHRTYRFNLNTGNAKEIYSKQSENNYSYMEGYSYLPSAFTLELRLGASNRLFFTSLQSNAIGLQTNEIYHDSNGFLRIKL